MSFDLIKYILLISYSFGGFLIAFYIHHKKKTGAPLVCPLRAKCHVVIHSEYSRFLNIPIELMGMSYYLLLAATYLALLVVPTTGNVIVFFALIFITTCAFVFSIYLTCLQIFVIKQFCSWCLLSALLCFMIFSITVISPPMGLDIVLAFQYKFLIAVHIVGIALGLGGATVTDIFFFKFLKDFKIDEVESEIMKTFSEVIWAGIILVTISGIGLYLPQRALFNQSAPFALKMTIVAVIFLNGLILNIVISPRTRNFIIFKQNDTDILTPIWIQRAAFAFGSISVSSWYTTLFLAMLKKSLVGIPYILLLLGYLGIVGTAIVVSQIIQRLMSRGIKVISI